MIARAGVIDEAFMMTMPNLAAAETKTGALPRNAAIDDGGKVDKKESDSADRGGADVDVDSTSFGASGGQPGQTDAKSADPAAHIPEVAKPEIIDYQGSHGQGTEDRPRDAFSEQMAGRPQPHNERPPEAPLGLNRNQAAVGASAVFAEPPVPRALTPRAIASLEKSLLAKVGAEVQREVSRSVTPLSPEALERAMSAQVAAMSKQLREELSRRFEEEGGPGGGGGGREGSQPATTTARGRIRFSDRSPPNGEQGVLIPNKLRELLAEENAALLSEVRAEIREQQRETQDVLLAQQRGDRAAEERARAEKQARLERGLVTLQSQLTKLEHEQRALERDQRSVTHAMKAHADAAAAELRRERDAVESTVKARVDEVAAQQSADLQRRTREEKERSEQLKQNLSDLQQQIRNLEIERSPLKSATGKASTQSQQPSSFSDAPRAPQTPRTPRTPRTPSADAIKEDIEGIDGLSADSSRSALDPITHESHASLCKINTKEGIGALHLERSRKT